MTDKRIDLDAEEQKGFCTFINADPIALAYEVIDGKIVLAPTVSQMLVNRLFSISGQPTLFEQSDFYGIKYYDNEGKAEVASLAVKVRGDSYKSGWWWRNLTCGRNKNLDKNGLYAVTVA